MIIQFADGTALATTKDEMQNYEKLLHHRIHDCKQGADNSVQKAYEEFCKNKGFGYPIEVCGVCSRWHLKMIQCSFCSLSAEEYQKRQASDICGRYDVEGFGRCSGLPNLMNRGIAKKELKSQKQTQSVTTI